jgi:hypothetical protein
MRRSIGLFLYSAGGMLLLTGLAKLVSSFGSARMLQQVDPILGLSYHSLFIWIGILELIVASVCFFSKHVGLRASLVAWLATDFVVYRLGLWWIGERKPCRCMGNFTDVLHISPHAADNLMKIILAYLLIGSCITLLWLWRRNGRPFSTIPPIAAVSQ